MGSYIAEKSICQEALEVFPSESQGRMWLHITLTLSQSGYSADKKPRVVFVRERTKIGCAHLFLSGYMVVAFISPHFSYLCAFQLRV